jgi:zinc/manganese transport system permease protein
VQLVGVYLVFTSLIVPALATLRWQGRGRCVVAYAVGAAGYAIGLALSGCCDLPPGPTIVCALACVAVCTPLAPRGARPEA